MSFSLTLSGNSSVLSYNFNPPIYLEENIDYEIGLVTFDSFNTIPNVDKSNNVFAFSNYNIQYNFKIPVGAYELNDLINVIKQKMTEIDKDSTIDIIPNLNTSRVSLKSNRKILFDYPDSIGTIFGFNSVILKSNTIHESTNPVKILKVNSIGVDCSIALGSYLNGNPVHIIHQFFPTVPTGYKIVESPQNILYYPVSVGTINNVTVKIIDQHGNPINFQGEEITVTLHIRKSL